MTSHRAITTLVVTGHSDLPETHTLIGLKQAGINIDVMCPRSAPHIELLRDAGIDVIDLELKSRFDRQGIRRIRRQLTINQYNILHVFNNKATSNGLIASRRLPLKIIAYRGIVGNVSFLDPASWTTYLHPRVHRIVCVANAVSQYLLDLRLLNLKIPRKKIITIHKGHSLRWYRKEPADLSTFDIHPKAFVVGCIANYRPRKGIKYLIEATKHLPADADIHIALIGNMERPKLLKQIQKSPYKDKIHLLGYRKDAPQIISACDVCILPAIKREGLPKSIIEGMVNGVPPIVTNSGGSPELLEDGISGIIIPPKSSQAIAGAILQLYENPVRRQQMGLKARQRIAENFDIQKTIERTLMLYRALAAEA